MVSVEQATRCCALCALSTLLLLLGSGFCPDAVAAQATPAQRRDELMRMFRQTKVVPAPIVSAEVAWTIKLANPPSAPGVIDDTHVYIPLRQGLLVALHRETGLLAWLRPIETTAPAAIGGGRVFAVSAGAIWALDAATGEYLWSTPVDATLTAPLIWDSGWLIAPLDTGEVLAFRAADGRLVWRRSVGAPSVHPAVPGGRNALYLALSDGRVVSLALETGEILWERKLPGMLSPPAVARERVFVGSTDNFFYAFDADTGRDEWKWRNGGDVIGAASDGDLVYFASLDNMIRAVNRGNGNQRWRKPTGTRPVLPPHAFRGIVVLPGLMPAITVFVGETGAVLGTHVAQGDLVGPPLVDPAPKPFSVAFITVTREGLVEALRPTAMMFREPAAVAVTALPGRPLGRDRMN